MVFLVLSLCIDAAHGEPNAADEIWSRLERIDPTQRARLVYAGPRTDFFRTWVGQSPKIPTVWWSELMACSRQASPAPQVDADARLAITRGDDSIWLDSAGISTAEARREHICFASHYRRMASAMVLFDASLEMQESKRLLDHEVSDGWGHSIEYDAKARGTCHGADGVPGGGGFDADFAFDVSLILLPTSKAPIQDVKVVRIQHRSQTFEPDLTSWAKCLHSSTGPVAELPSNTPFWTGPDFALVVTDRAGDRSFQPSGEGYLHGTRGHYRTDCFAELLTKMAL